MRIYDFIDAVNSHSLLKGQGITHNCNGDVCFIISYASCPIKTVFTAAEIEANDWPVLESIMTGKREPNPLRIMTRIVGYFSNVANWNPSKVSELRDRQKGNYRVKCQTKSEITATESTCQDNSCKL